jgi:prevent-host-death family protein
MEEIGIRELKARASEVVRAVKERRARYVITQRGRPAAVLVPLVFAHGNVNHMIANADVVITQQSTCTFVVVALGKEVYTNLDVAQLKELMPLQNGGASAERIANVCRRLLLTPVPVLHKVRRGLLARPRWEQEDAF